MNTLLEKVQRVEQEAASLVAQAEAEGKQQVAAIQENEVRMLEDVRRTAEQKAAAIVKERVRAAKDEVGKLQQEREASLSIIHEAAERNRQDVLAFLPEAFEQEYLS